VLTNSLFLVDEAEGIKEVRPTRPDRGSLGNQGVGVSEGQPASGGEKRYSYVSCSFTQRALGFCVGLDRSVRKPRKFEVDGIIEHAAPHAAPSGPNLPEISKVCIRHRGDREVKGVSELVGAFAGGCDWVGVLSGQITTVKPSLLTV